MSTPDTPVITTAREILHDTEYFEKSREYARYWDTHFVKKQAEAMQCLMDAVTFEDFRVARALYSEYSQLLTRMETDRDVNQNILDVHNRKHAQ